MRSLWNLRVLHGFKQKRDGSLSLVLPRVIAAEGYKLL